MTMLHIHWTTGDRGGLVRSGQVEMAENPKWDIQAGGTWKFKDDPVVYCIVEVKPRLLESGAREKHLFLVPDDVWRSYWLN
jgi:hypothetical protein